MLNGRGGGWGLGGGGITVWQNNNNSDVLAPHFSNETQARTFHTQVCAVAQKLVKFQ